MKETITHSPLCPSGMNRREVLSSTHVLSAGLMPALCFMPATPTSSALVPPLAPAFSSILSPLHLSPEPWLRPRSKFHFWRASGNGTCTCSPLLPHRPSLWSCQIKLWFPPNRWQSKSARHEPRFHLALPTSAMAALLPGPQKDRDAFV